MHSSFKKTVSFLILFLSGYIPFTYASFNLSLDSCQPIYYLEKGGDDKEILLCLKDDDIIYYYKNNNDINIKRFHRSDIIVNKVNDDEYEFYFTSINDKKCDLIIYSFDDNTMIIDVDLRQSIIRIDQKLEVNNLWNLLKN